jgi:glutamyl-tRNA(Gln) amidotransferase subunit D
MRLPEGSEVRVEKGGVVYEGRAMPSPEGVLIIKLENGYNVGLRIDPSLKVVEIGKGAKGSKRSKRSKGPKRVGGGRVAILGTGGTIASYVDYTTGAVHPARNTSELLSYIPEILEVADVEAKIVFSILSEDMVPENWRALAEEVKREFDGGCKGVVITHGTDTMSYTASALAFIIREQSGPVVLTGSQRSTDRPSSDGFLNLLYSTRAALTDLGEVVVAMHEGSSDGRVALHRACRVRKMHTSARGAFKSVDVEPIGYVYPDRVYLGEHDGVEDKTVVDLAMDDKVGILYSYPGLDVALFEAFSEKLDGLVMAGTGLGHCPSAIVPSIKKMVEDGRPVIMTSQCIYGRPNLNVYSRGRDLLRAGVLVCDMLPEVAMVKLGWVLGHTKDPEEVRELMERELAHEFCYRRFL